MKRVLFVCVCLWACWCAKAQILYQEVMVGDSVTNISLTLRYQHLSGLPLVGVLRRGHACIDWTLRGALTVPPTIIDYDGTPYPILAVGFHAFYKCVGLTRVTLPPTARLLGYEVFYGCSALTEVRLPDSLLMVGERAFCGCPSLRRIVLPCAVPPRCAADAFDASAFRQALLVVPQGCREAYRAAEQWCRFQRIDEGEEAPMPSAPADYDYWQRKKEAMETLHADERWRKPQRVEDDVNWTAMVSTSQGNIPMVFSTRRAYHMAVAGSGVAGECCIDTTFAGTLTLPDSITAPDGRRMMVGGVAMNAFSGCRRLQGVGFPRHMEFIDSYAFADCQSLREVVIPEDMREILSSAFTGCAAVCRVVTLAPTPPDLFVDAFDDHTFSTATLVVPEDAMEAYMATDAWTLFPYRMENY